jgi:hypothetical protein
MTFLADHVVSIQLLFSFCLKSRLTLYFPGNSGGPLFRVYSLETYYGKEKKVSDIPDVVIQPFVTAWNFSLNSTIGEVAKFFRSKVLSCSLTFSFVSRLFSSASPFVSFYFTSGCNNIPHCVVSISYLCLFASDFHCFILSLSLRFSLPAPFCLCMYFLLFLTFYFCLSVSVFAGWYRSSTEVGSGQEKTTRRTIPRRNQAC